MDFNELKGLPLGDVINATVAEGGATVAGVFGAGFLGRRFQGMMGKPESSLTAASSLTDAITTWAYNNAPKVAAWYLLRGKNYLGSATPDVQKGIVTSVALDTALRLANHGMNSTTVSIYGYEILGDARNAAGNGISSVEVQKLIQENSVLRAELSRTRSAGARVQQTNMPQIPATGYGIDERERKYAFMPGMGTPGIPMTPGASARQTRYGFAGEVQPMGATGKPGAAYIQAGKMFNMQ